MNTPETEWEKWCDTLAGYSGSASNENFKAHKEATIALLTSRDAYWKERVKEARNGVIKTVEDTIAEFGDQGMECVAGILQESFHGQKNVEH